MSTRSKLLQLVGFSPLSHRPPLSTRFWFYSASAYLFPVVVQVALPEDPGLTDELVWLITLAPAFLLSLHYGIRGAFAALMMGTALFIVVQIVVALNFTPDDWRITVPIYIAYGTLAISVGSLSEQLHGYYTRALKNERMAAIGQFAVTVRHEINNALTAIVTESQLLAADQEGLNADQQASAESIHHAAMRIAENVRKITNLADAPVTTYAGGIKMIDLESAREKGLGEAQRKEEET
ncbi:MAG: histidine kinase dimerization/phospho-acceptor domain-containing protein [Gemmatimonadales bacterium]|jgi:signal transduction histidine kinase